MPSIDELFDTVDAPLRVSCSLSLHALALLIVGTLALVVAAGASRELGRRGARWQWFGWFALFKGLSIFSSLSLGLAYGWASPDFFRSIHLLFALPAWLAAANFAWSALPLRSARILVRLLLWLWLGGVGIAGLTGGLDALARLESLLAVGVGLATLSTLGTEIRALDKRARMPAALGLLLMMVGLAGIITLETAHDRLIPQTQGWTANTLADFTAGDFSALHAATAFACLLSLGWWLWMRFQVNQFARRDWLRRALWLIPCGQFALCIVGVSSLNHLRSEGATRADLIYSRHAHTAALGLELAGRSAREDPATLGDALGRLVRATSDFETAALVRIDGAGLNVLAPANAALPAKITLWRKGGDDDPRPGQAREAFVSSFMQDAHGTFLLCCEPWSGGDDQWLVLRVDYRSWCEIMGPMLGQASVIVLLACVLGVSVVVFLIQRELSIETDLGLARALAANEAKSEVLSRASHELRTPIQGMLGYADLLGRSRLTQRQTEWLDSLSCQGGHLLGLVNDLLDLGALQHGRLTLEPRVVSPAQTAREALAAVRPQAETRSLACELRIDPAVPAWVRGDPMRMRQILVNLLGNAVKFTEAGSIRLAISATVTRTPDTTLLRFSVTDTGPGIAPEDLPKLFEPHGRTRRHPAEGAGLGLPLTRSLCIAMGGGLEVESAPGIGSTFHADMRVAIAPAPAPTPSAEAGLLPALGLRVLVVEDNVSLRALLGDWLRELGCPTTLVADGEAALSTARFSSFDVIVLDLGLPGIDGREVARRLRALPLRPPPRIVGLSAHAGEADRVSSLAAGMDAFLTKPVQLSTLAAALRGKTHSTAIDETDSGTLAAKPDKPGGDTGGLLASKLISTSRADALRNLAMQDMAARHAELCAALAVPDWERVAKIAHYLANTADLLGDAALRAACVACEDAARSGDATRAREAAGLIANRGPR